LQPLRAVGAAPPHVEADAASAAAVAATGDESTPLTGESTFAEDYWQALLGGETVGARDEGAG